VHPIRGIGTLIVTVIVAAIVGFGVPLGWVWIGSQVQGGSGATSLDFSVAMLILFGIIITYVGVLWIAGWVLARVDPHDPQRQQSSSRTPWMRGMTDTRAIKPRGADKAWEIETVFVGTTLIVTAAFWLWFLFIAGSPLPNQ
jgi:hypothetical protein